MTHGTLNCYTRHRCRCDPCCEAKRAYQRDYYQRTHVPSRHPDRPAFADIADLLHELFPLGLTDDAPARKALRG